MRFEEPTEYELAEAFKSLGAPVPPRLAEALQEKDELLDSILADLEALGGSDVR